MVGVPAPAAIIPGMGRRATKAVVYLAAGIAAGAGALAVFPLFTDHTYRGSTSYPPTVVVIQDKPIGAHRLSVSIEILFRYDTAHLILEELDQSGDSRPGATTYIGLRYSRGGGDDYYEPLNCRVDTGNDPKARLGISPISGVWARAIDEGALGGSADQPGEVTTVTLDEPVTAVKTTCPLPEFGFRRESLANWNVYLPGVLTAGVGGAERPVVSYWIDREPSDYIVQVSQQPSEVLARSYSWYERDHDLLARQGLFLTISNPGLQQEGAYRLFIAGALLGLGGGFIVAAAQTSLGKE